MKRRRAPDDDLAPRPADALRAQRPALEIVAGSCPDTERPIAWSRTRGNLDRRRGNDLHRRRRRGRLREGRRDLHGTGADRGRSVGRG